MRKGYIQVYTGDGKGKTTAALGLALRAAGAGLKVFIAQFVKDKRYSEHRALDKLSDFITVKQYGTGYLFGKKPGKSDIDSAKKGLEEVKELIASGIFDLVILDEINIATHYSILDVRELIEILDSKPIKVEIILTGRYADERIIERADIVTEMKEVKHYLQSGVKARIGIEF
ncbi:MAG: cob(I)yrinic acid a,c-diamide adenosyltransferase [Methanosarcinales archaeon]|nr:cob(I)yrinic acid a,c-diamide adenosyltransferase [Methanosarcinales archaeon]